MSRENKFVLSDFVNGERFELNSYLNYLFRQFYADERDHLKDNMVKHPVN